MHIIRDFLKDKNELVIIHFDYFFPCLKMAHASPSRKRREDFYTAESFVCQKDSNDLPVNHDAFFDALKDILNDTFNKSPYKMCPNDLCLHTTSLKKLNEEHDCNIIVIYEDDSKNDGDLIQYTNLTDEQKLNGKAWKESETIKESSNAGGLYDNQGILNALNGGVEKAKWQTGKEFNLVKVVILIFRCFIKKLRLPLVIQFTFNHTFSE